MAEIVGTVCVENNTARVILLPSLEEYPMGIRLIPGLNRVPKQYMEDLHNHCVENTKKDEKGKTTYRYPGRALMKQLTEDLVTIVTQKGSFEGVQLTVYEHDQVGRPDGILPDTLETYKEEAALKIISIVDDTSKLRNYTRDKRSAVKMTAQAKLTAIQTMQTAARAAAQPKE